MKVEFNTFRGKPVEDSNYYKIVCMLLGERRAKRWVKTIQIPLGKE